MQTTPTSELESSVSQRYGEAAKIREAALCCPVDYDRRYLEAIPDEVIERDYGCGDPSLYCREGDTVLDLGSGTGKICFIASQIVGARGRVIGVDMTDEMLEVAQRNAPIVAERIGYENVGFLKGRIQDLATDVAAAEEHLRTQPVSSLGGWEAFEEHLRTQRRTAPLVADGSVDLIVSNCVLNLVHPGQKRQLFAEMFRVLRRGGRIAISDIVSDEEVPEHLAADPELWSGCISGALTEEAFMRHLMDAGFHGMAIDNWVAEPFAVVDGIEFRSVTITAHKGKQGPCYDHNQAVVYRGPWSSVTDDDGHRLERGVRVAVCKKTFDLYTRGPYSEDIVPIEPREPVAANDAPLFAACDAPMIRRHPRESKGLDYHAVQMPTDACCDPEAGCC